MIQSRKSSLLVTRAARAVVEHLEQRQLLSAALSVSNPLMVFNAVNNSSPSPVETLTLTDTGDMALTLGAGSITLANDPSSATQDVARFTLVNAASIPATLAPGSSFGLQIDYSAITVTDLFNSALLDIATNDPVSPTQVVTLHGIGTKGLGGSNQPSLATILRAYDIPTIVGDGPHDANAFQDNTYPYPPDLSSQEVLLQRLVKAGPGPVTINVLASFTANLNPPFTLGTYTPGTTPSGLSQLFTTPASEYQSTYVQPQGATSFDPGTSQFGFYCISNVQVANRHIYTEDYLNTFDSTTGRHFRFFPMETPTGTIIPNQYIMTTTEWDAPIGYDFTNIVAIVSNVMPAPVTNTTPVMGLQNINQLPSSNNLIFDRIQNPNVTLGDQVHDTNLLQINNNGGSPLIVNSVALSDPANWKLVSPPAFPLTIPIGASYDLTIKFVAQFEPPHPYNETEFTVYPNNGGVYSGTVTINSNDPVNPAQSRALEGYWQRYSENNSEAGLQTVVNLMAGYGTVIRPGYPDLNEGPATKYYGEETVSAYWARADSSTPISVMQLNAGHTEGNTASLYWYAQGTKTTHTLLTTAADDAQSLFPLQSGTTTPAAAKFSPSTAVGFKVDNQWSDDSFNPSTPIGGHYIRFFPVRAANGFLVPNTYILAMEYLVLDVTTENFDFQDNIYIISNIHPVASNAVTAPQTTAAPPAPASLTATATSGGVSLAWPAIQDSTLQGYNIYTSPAATSGFSLLTSGVTTTSYLDTTAPPGTPVFYRVTAADASGAESLGTEAGTTTLGTAVSGLSSLDIGATPLGSTTVVTPGTDYNVVAGGPGVTGNTDGFRFLFQQQTGDFDMKVQVPSLTVAGNFATAGIMARSTLDSNSPDVYMSASPVNYRFKDRTSIGGSTSVTVGGTTAFPGAWVRLSRVGNVFNGYSSPDGVTWTLVSTITLALPGRLYLGLAVASNVTTSTTSAQLRSFENTAGGPVANSDTANAISGAPTIINVLGNDTDPTGTINPAAVTISTPPSQGGQALLNPDGTITYTSTPGFTGTETFSYTVGDGSVTSQQAVVTVTVVASGLVTVPETFNVTAGQTLLVNVLASDTDSTGTINPATLSIVGDGGGSQGGTAVVQSGEISYTPAAGFTGTDTLSYQVKDSNNVTSAPTLLTFIVTSGAAGPIANPDSASTTSGQSVQINVLANDTSANGLNPATVTVASAPNHGIAQVDPTTGIITYTAAIGFTGTDSFTYTVDDNNGVVSQPATVTIQVTAAGPVAANLSQPILLGSGSTTIDVLSQATDGKGMLNPASVAITTSPADGAATVNTSNGSITYTPTAGFVGTDTLQYTVGDGTNVSAPATLSVSVGLTINTTTAKSLTFVDAAGNKVTLALTGGGTGEVFFTGSGTSSTRLTSGTSGTVSVSGTGLGISAIDLTGTTTASSLKISRKGRAAIALGGLTVTGSMNRIIAPFANLTGALVVSGSLTLLQLASANGATITVGTSSTPLTFSAGHVVNTSLDSGSPIKSLKVIDWTSTGTMDSISALSIASLITTGNFQASLVLGGGSIGGTSILGPASAGNLQTTQAGTASTPLALGSVRIGGQIAADPWAITGPVSNIIVGSVAPGWTGNFSAAINSFSIRAGGFAGTLTAGSINTLSITGNDTGSITAASIRSARIAGQFNGASLTLTTAVAPKVLSLGRLTVTGRTINSTIASAGNIGAIATAGISGSSIDAGVNSGVTLPAAATDFSAAAGIASFTLTGRGATFASTDIGATTIGSLSLGEIITSSSTAFGIGADTIKSLSAKLDTLGVLRLSSSQLLSGNSIAAYVTAHNLTLNSFVIRPGL